ncbi:phosphotransferase [Pseudomonas reactans]|nr:phosphotransferase [Pseudomonas reactans]
MPRTTTAHGDLCDTNVFVDAHDQLHFIDLGRGGIADRWLDIAFAHRNLREDISDNAANNFLRGLGEPDQSAKRVYFEQLIDLDTWMVDSTAVNATRASSGAGKLSPVA